MSKRSEISARLPDNSIIKSIIYDFDSGISSRIFMPGCCHYLEVGRGLLLDLVGEGVDLEPVQTRYKLNENRVVFVFVEPYDAKFSEKCPGSY